MSKTALVVSSNNKISRDVRELAKLNGFKPVQSTGQTETLEKTQKHLPNIIFIDFDLQAGCTAMIRRITDYRGINTRVVIISPDHKVKAAAQVADKTNANAVIRYKSPNSIEKEFNHAVESPGFDGVCRATFISKDGTRETQTHHGVARVVQAEDRPVATVIDNHVPNWIRKGDDVVVGYHGELVTSFDISGIKRVTGYGNGMDSLAICYSLSL